MKAIIVPGITDLNKGDQALVWESHRLIKDLNVFQEILILRGGGTEKEKRLLSSQTEKRGYNLIEGILRHPRRGKHSSKDHVKESKSSYVRLIKNGVLDFTRNTSIISMSNLPLISSFFFEDDILETIDQFRKCDVVFVKGGGFLHAHGEFFAPYLIWYFLFYIRLAQKLGKKVIVLPNSFGPFQGLTVESQLKTVLGKCNLIYAREQISADLVSSILPTEVKVKPDLGLYLQSSSDTKLINSILSKYNLNDNKKIIGLTVRPWRFPGHKDNEDLYKKYIHAISDFSAHVSQKGYKVVVCNQSIGPNSHEDDRNAIQDLLAISNDITWVDEDLDCDVLKAIYSKFYCLLGTRFHSVIFALTSHVPCIAIGYGGNKAKGIMTDFGLDDFVVPIDLVDTNSLLELFSNLEKNHHHITDTLSKGMKNIELERNLMINDILETLEKS